MEKPPPTSPEKLLQIRQQRIADAVALKETDQVPYFFATRYWSAKLAGISFKEFMYDIDAAVKATKQAIKLLEPDAYSATIYSFGRAMDEFGFRPMKWPGNGLGDNDSFQYLDKEYMTAAEYDEFLTDPTRFYLHKYLPRISEAGEALGLIPDFTALAEWGLISGLRAYADPKLQEGFQRLFRAGEAAEETMQKTRLFVQDMKVKGFPAGFGGFCKAPFDHVVDAMRGSKGGMLDMFRNKEKLLEMVALARVQLLRGVAEGAKKVGVPYVFIPLHWGIDGFMSPDQFKTFYWPFLRQTIIELIEDGVVPTVFWEGKCDTRLELIGDIPAGKAIYWFEATDMFRAKEVLGDVVCIRGNVPASLLITGTSADVDEHCKKLIKGLGKGGGFILEGSASVPDEAPIENIVAMANSVRKYKN